MKKFLCLLCASAMCLSLVACGDPCKDGHQWTKATCTEAEYCSVCNTQGSEALGHTFGEAKITKETSCAEAGAKTFTCSVCGFEKNEDIPAIAHTPGEWEIVSQATATTKGKKAQKCSVCGGTVVEEEFEKSAAEIKSDYISNCANYTYKEISRNPDNYKGKYAHFKGEIIQSIESGDSYTFRVNISRTSWGWTDTILVSYTKKEASESRLLEDDVVDLYGMLAGTHTYETVMGNEMTIPLLYAEYVILN